MFRSVLPHRIGTGSSDKFLDAIGNFLLHEAESFNETLAFLRIELKRFACNWNCQDALTFGSGQIPRKWRVATRLWTLRNVDALESHLTRRHSQLHRWFSQGTDLCDLSLVDDPRYLLECHLIQAAMELGEDVDYNFAIAERPREPTPRVISLIGAKLLGGELTGDLGLALIADPRRSPICAVDCLVGEIVPIRTIVKDDRRLEIPLYRQMLTTAMGFDNRETRIVEGDTNNLVWRVGLLTELTVDEMLLNGTCMFCQMTDQF
jgi:hypothetical protein